MGFISEFRKGLDGEPEGVSYEMAGKLLVCPHCGCERFWRRPAQLNTAGATFFDLDFANKTVRAYVCAKCGRIEWFEK